MAALPAALKAADVQRFATRAAQLEKFKPIVTYWLEYYILQRIIKDSLHTQSDEASQYAIQLMDKLEQTKSEYSTEPAVTDDNAAKAYMEQFATQTFDRADQAQNNNKVTRQTADTFQAAATFFDSLSIWGELDTESKAKSKFAKFHALRIARALKEGKDPNETNPEVKSPEPAATLDENEAELKQIEREVNEAALQPSIEPVPDEDAGSFSTSHAAPPAVSPIDAEVPVSDRPVSIGGGYFPSVPKAEQTIPTTAGAMTPVVDEKAQTPRQATVADMVSSNIDNETHIPTVSQAVPSDPLQFYAGKPAAPPAPAPTQPSSFAATNYNIDDAAVLSAQKHAKWAISALNFDDVPTAVKELRIALQSLGGL